jgi:carbonic anhydrase
MEMAIIEENASAAQCQDVVAEVEAPSATWRVISSVGPDHWSEMSGCGKNTHYSIRQTGKALCPEVSIRMSIKVMSLENDPGARKKKEGYSASRRSALSTDPESCSSA